MKRLTLCGLFLLTLGVRGESLVSNFSIWKYLEGTREASDPPTAWWGPDFEDSQWKEGRSGFSIGFGNYDAPTQLWGMPDGYPSLFLRKRFTLEDTEWIQSLVMRVDYDDGFVAYLNGTEVARRGLAGEPDQPVPFNALAAVHYRGNPELIDLEPYRLLLEEGENILAVQAHNSSVISSQFAFHVELLANVVRGPFIQSTTTSDTKIAWHTLNPTTSVIEYGPTPALGQRIESDTPNTDHVLQLVDLEPNTTYRYRVGGVAEGVARFSKTATFKTLKPSGPVKLMLLGDAGRGNLIQHKIATLLRSNAPNAVMFAGDLVYPTFTEEYADFRHFSIYKEHMKSTPYFNAIGNHELYNGDTAYLNSFYLPTNNLPALGLKMPKEDYRFSGTEHFYSFDVGDAHVSVLYNPWYAFHDFSKDTNQLHWLTNDLATTSKPWKFLLMHQPVATSTSHGWSSYGGSTLPDTVDFGNTIYPIVAKYGVDLMLAGHSHTFEKFNPVDGCISVVSGGGGATPYPLHRFYPGTSQFWSRNNVTLISIDGDQLKLEALDPNGEVFDWFVINRKSPERDLWDATWGTPQIESSPDEAADKNLQGQVFDLIGEPIPAIKGASANLGQVRVNNDHTHLYIGFEQTMIGPNQNIFLFIESPRQNGVSSLQGLGNGKLDFNGGGADGLDFLQNLTFTGFKPSLAAILGDETADSQNRHFGRPRLTIKVSTGINQEDTAVVPFPLGQGVFQLDQMFSDVAGTRFQQFNRSPQLVSQPEETDANFIELAIPYSALGGLQPGDEIVIGAVVGTGETLIDQQYRRLDTTHLGKGLKIEEDIFYQLEGLKVRLANDPEIAIAVQPVGGTLGFGDSISMWVLASGHGTLSYQWKKDGVAIAGETSNILSLTDAKASDSGLYSVTIQNSVSTVDSADAIISAGKQMILGTIASQFVKTGDSLSVAVQLSGKPTNLKYALSGAPDVMSISSEGLISWVVGSEHDGNSYNVRVLAIDQDALLAVGRNFSVTVNHNPKWEAIGSQSVKEQNLLTFAPVAIDLDDTDLSLIASGLPAGASYDSNSGFTWTPGNGQIGVHNVGFTVTDPHGSKSDLTVQITVNANVVPTLAAISSVSILAGESAGAQAVVSDDDDDSTALIYRLDNAPEGMQVSESGVITWATQSGIHSGKYTADVVVTDPLGASASQQLTVVVDGAPVVESIDAITLKIGGNVDFAIRATDPEGGEMTYKVLNTPDGFKGKVSNGFKGKFRWYTKNAVEGNFTIDIEVADAVGLKSVVSAQIILKTNVAPTIGPLEPVVVSAGGTLNVQVVANDPDGDNIKLKYQLQNAPEEMTISGGGLIEWMVGIEAEGGTREVTVLVLDELESSAKEILSVTVNLPPKLERIGPQTVQIGQVLVIKPSATGPNNAELMFAAVDLPAGGVFDSGLGFSWAPTQEQLGVHQVLFVVTDLHGVGDEELVVVTVTKAVMEPALSLLSSRNVTGAFTHEEDAIIDEGNGIITVVVKEDMVFYRLRFSGETKLEITGIAVQDDKVAITYETVDE